MPYSTTLKPILWTAILLVVAGAVQSPLIISNPVAGRAAFTEGGMVEQFTVYLWIAAAVVAAWRSVRGERLRVDFVLLAAVFLVLAFRELDLNRHLFTWNLTRFVNYKKAYIPLGERLAAFGLILLPIIVGTIALFARNFRRLIAGVRARERWTLLVLFWMVLIGLTRVADKVAQAVHDEVPHLLLMGMEEMGECVLALYTLLIFMMLRQARGAVAPR